ncbi:MED14-domain-containing protein [Fomitiporia mediterranea MF3/22]|uniref:MED14-domain-containing protein n=1 Tax=Fomitiporia mediterranea (strain MF3/22) TaxID=694068 RepID=UPI0004408CD9|nr:MED14-domain-containing protein [Fomitiporia mediterranea MF3/22]EJD03366.1 MED14-domain-containing protein [Fomitiporia mediterranea MF3/22]
METKINGIHPSGSQPPVNGHTDAHLINDILPQGIDGEPSLEEIERELPVVHDGQIPLRELLQRMVQTIYAELTEMAETLPGMSDAARKRNIADWVVKTKKQVVKLYAVMRWSRDAGDVQKAMNITAFLLEQNRQFEESHQAVRNVKESLAPARLRNHDLLTSLDVLTTGSYLRLPSQIKKFFITPPPLSNNEARKTLADMEERIRFRLRLSEIIPIEMSQFRIEDGRAHFIVPNLFETSLSLRGAKKDDGWFFVHVEFLYTVGGDLTDVQDFPRRPTGDLKRHIAEEADGRLAYYLPLPVDPNVPPELQPPLRPELPAGTVDTPLVRLFNFLQMMSLSYQLEILFFQAQRLRALGWRDYMSLERSRDGKSFTASYWVRTQTDNSARPGFQQRMRIPPIGGSVTVSLVETHISPRAGGGPDRSPKERILAKLQLDGKLRGSRPSDEVETFRVVVKWEPTKGALGAQMPPHLETLIPEELEVNPQDLNFEALLRKAITKHAYAILTAYQYHLENGPSATMFSFPGELSLTVEGKSTRHLSHHFFKLTAHTDGFSALRMHLCADEYITVSIDTRTGRILLRDTGGLAAAERAPQYVVFTEKINENPLLVYDFLVQARFRTILDLAEQKARYMGLQTFRSRNLPKEELEKLGREARSMLFVQLANFQGYYLVLLVTEVEFRFALISVQQKQNSPTSDLVLQDIGWLDVQRIHGSDAVVREQFGQLGSGSHEPPKVTGTSSLGGFGPFDITLGFDRFKLETEVLRELYSYCCARVAYTKVELQLKRRGIPCTYMDTAPSATTHPDLAHLQSSLVRSVPGLCVQSSDILAGVPAAEAAMPNIRVIPLNWWSNKKSQVVTCVKLKYVQQPVGKRAGTSTVIRPSKRIIYDAREAIVSFLSETVDTCVDEFLEEWAKVSKMVVIAREVAQMSKRQSWEDVRLLSFDLQTVEFAYAKDYTVSISCTDQLMLSNDTTYELFFSRIRKLGRSSMLAVPFDPLRVSDEDELYNPHEDAQPFLQHILRQGPSLSASLHQLVGLLRDSLPLVCVVDTLRRSVEVVEDRRVGVEVITKSVGWYRVMYGDFRHALDFRLMTGRRVVILDASLSARTTCQATQGRGKQISSIVAKSRLGKEADKEKSTTGTPSSPNKSPSRTQTGVLLPIPGFDQLIQDAIRESINNNSSRSPSSISTSTLPTNQSSRIHLSKKMNAVHLDSGVMCNVDAVESLAPRIHSRVLKSLASSAPAPPPAP